MKELINFIKSNLEIDVDVEKLLEKPKVKSHGDFSFPCFILSKELKKAPVQISQDLALKLSQNLPDFLEKVIAVGPFVNFYLDSQKEISQIFENFDSYLSFKTKTPQKILIEWPSPNTNKSLHIGHTRNMLLGNALCKTLEKVGNQVIKTSINNDRGISICYAMLMYQEFFSEETPESLGIKPDEFVANCYIKFKQACEEFPQRNYEIQAQEMLVKWELGDKEIRNLWEKLLNWVYLGYSKTYQNYNLPKFDCEFYESQIFDKGKEIVLKALDDKISGFSKEDDGAIFIDLEDKNYGKKYLLRGDGTTLYMTQDIYLAQLKEEKFSADKYVFIVGKEQEYHFNVLFEILSRLGFGGVDKNYHFAYGYVYNEEGKKFSSRLGNTIGADFVLDEMIKKAKENLLNKELTKNLPEEELDRRAKIIGFGALSFTFLKQNPLSDMNFSIENALSFEGETGPYCQYTYARIQSVKRKANYKKSSINYSLFDEREIELAKLIKEYPSILEEASTKYKLSSIANYALKLSQGFNDFYQNSSILKAESQDLKQARLELSNLIGIILKDALSILNIDVLDEM